MKKKILLTTLLAISLPAAALAQSNGRLLVAQKGDMSLAIVDPASGTIIANVPEGGNTVHEVTGTPDGKLAFAPVYGNSGVGKPGTDGNFIDVIDVPNAKVISKIEFSHGVRPHLPVYNPKDGLIYVSTELDHTITIIDPKSFKIVGAINTGQPESHMFVIAHNGIYGYTANVGAGTVSVLDIKTRKLARIIPIARQVQRISISANDRFVFTSDVDKPRLAVLDTASGDVTHWIDLPGHGYGSATTSDGKWLLIAVPDANKMAIIDLKTWKVANTVDTPPDPQEVLITPDGKTAYVSCMGKDQKVVEIDTATWKTRRLIATGKATDGLGWAGN